MRFDCIHYRKATTQHQGLKGAFIRMLTFHPCHTEQEEEKAQGLGYVTEYHNKKRQQVGIKPICYPLYVIVIFYDDIFDWDHLAYLG